MPRKTSVVKIKQDQENPIPVEVIAESIKQIAAALRKMRESPLNDRAIELLIQNAAPCGRSGQKIPITDVRAVLQGIDDLARTYLKQKKERV